MNKREKLILICVGALGALGVAFFIGRYVWAEFTVRYASIEKLEKEVQNQKRVISRRPGVEKQFAAYEARAMPPQIDQAGSLYREFLLETAIAHAGLNDVNVTPFSGSSQKSAFPRLGYSLKAEGRLDQVARFMYLFYSADYLHRIAALRVVAKENSKDLQITFNIEAVSLPGAPARTKLAAGKPKPLALGSEAEYMKRILGRNIFGPPNQPPKLTVASSQQATTKKPFSFVVKVAENELLDRVKFELESPSASGATLKAIEGGKPGDPPSATFSWTPTAKGEYSFTVRAIDDGLPAKEDKKTFKVVVKDPAPTRPIVVTPPASKPAFDVAKHTYLTSILEADGEPGIWLIERTSGKKHELHVGDKFQVGTVKGIVTKIGRQEVEIEVGGNRLILFLGSSLTEAQSLGL